ncbi:hypothetical protein QSJ19_00935 [Gordonia sp. ABSL11-1]|uniref:glycine-rich domain-containing protein n=1 Tax=Gordonia sp. ABSL11-1 TaxID=3053924 RepID=UPI0025743B36|nr:hypothetical protein [Gordonia sp. ABSL11-1]MDL9944166.1 hypothetical protein [Gordonia sp. ABSL11-1]
MTRPDLNGPGDYENPDYNFTANLPNPATGGLNQFASRDRASWEEFIHNNWQGKTQDIGGGAEIIRIIAHEALMGVGNIVNGIFNGWFGSGSVGDPLEVQYTIEAIKDAIINGYNVETKVTSGIWTKPSNISELVVIMVGCGQNGGDGSTGNRGPGGVGGIGGGYIAQQIDPATLGSTVNYTVGASNGAVSSFGSYSTTPGGSGISTSFGFTPTTSAPGNGGNGGIGTFTESPSQSSTAGTSGSSSALATGGSGGAAGATASWPNNTYAGNGAAGGNVSAGSTTKCGGAGGGGGGGAGQAPASTTANAGAGGPGGYPGGAGGGGGARGAFYVNATSQAGAGGIGATGIIWIFWK